MKNFQKFLLTLFTNKATGPDDIPAKFVQMSDNVSDCHLSNIIVYDISKNKYSDHAKTTTVRPVFKKDDRTKIKNYWPVRLSNMFEIYENVRKKISRKIFMKISGIA